MDDQNVLRFLSSNKDHKFLYNHEHGTDTVLAGLFQQKVEEQKGEDEEDENKEKAKKCVYYDEEDIELKSVIEDKGI
jgi:hypothetical protein